MSFQLVNVFERPYENKEFFDLSPAEKIELLRKTGDPKSLTQKGSRVMSIIDSHYSAAVHTMCNQVDNGLYSHIETVLKNAASFKAMIASMPKENPSSIWQYKHKYSSCELQETNADIQRFGRNLHVGQVLFHGGYFPSKEKTNCTTTRPLSTSFCPQVALLNAIWKGKAFDNGEIHLLVLRVKSPHIKAFVFDFDEGLGAEKEVLIASEVILHVTKISRVREDYLLCKLDEYQRELQKNGASYVIEVDIESIEAQ